jgi:hypothetical protein
VTSGSVLIDRPIVPGDQRERACDRAYRRTV